MDRENDRNIRSNKSTYIRKRRRKRRTLSLISMFLLTIIALLLIVFLLFRIKLIKVENSITSTYTGEQIINASGLKEGQNLLAFSKKSIRKKILNKLPYIGNVKISRKLPNTVVLTISEKTDYVCIPYRGGYLIVSTDMQILSNAFVQQEGIPAVYGLVPLEFNPGDNLKAKDQGSVEALKAVLDQAARYNLIDKISAINVHDKLDVYMVYDERILIRFGSIAKLDYKFELLFETLTNKLNNDFSGNVNLSASKYVYVSEGEMRFPAGFFDIGFSDE